MSLEFAAEHLGWPSREEILKPAGTGPRVFAELAEEKLGKALRLRPDVQSVNIGVLMLDSAADATEAPVAVVCEFHHPVLLETLEEAHRLAWNFCRSPLLVTVEPNVVRAWTCCEPPSDLGVLDPFRGQVEALEVSTYSQQAAKSLHWVELASGEFFRKHDHRFRRDRCADGMLLDNLMYVRERLHARGLPYEICHDLLARLIFIQFLFQRKDSAGNPALTERTLRQLHERRTLKRVHRTLAGILQHHDDAFALFRWLNDRFNGDLFPGKGQTEAEREADWEREMNAVKPEHLTLLSQFVSGEIEMRAGQFCLWPQYYFDAIPLEFISSIYEVFVHKGGGGGKSVHYTPGHLVDFMLDAVLPWDHPQWDVRVLDPACGSGIFLVKSFQRLVYRWRQANPNQDPSAEVLRRILERNLMGVDIDEDAVRVASFSLYLAMCDEIDPRHYWTRVQFPRLRGNQLKHADFFCEDVPGIRTGEDAGRYDLVVGNAPWGTRSVTELAQSWADSREWQTAYKDLGPLFLPKAAALAKPGGWVTMLQPAGALLFNGVGTALRFRKMLFSKFDVTEIVNLSALRFGLFQKAISPACIITMRAAKPSSTPVTYICPKSVQTHEDDFRVIIEPTDINSVSRWEAGGDPLIWTVFTWGGRRDYELVRRLRALPTLASLARAGLLLKRQGIVRGNRKHIAQILDKRILTGELPPGTSIYLDPSRLPLNEDAEIHSKDSRSFEAFKLPQLIIKQAWASGSQRFQAVLVRDTDQGAILCSESYVTVHAKEGATAALDAACVSLNSCFAVYYLLLTSGRFASYRPEPNTEDLLAVPIPLREEDAIGGAPAHLLGAAHVSASRISKLDTPEALDNLVREAFGFRDVEWVLIKDLFDYTLPDFKGDLASPGRAVTQRLTDTGTRDPDLVAYGEQFLKVLKAGFGRDKQIQVNVFHDGSAPLPVRLVGVHLGGLGDGISLQEIDSDDLRRKLLLLNTQFLSSGDEPGGIFSQRVARIFDTFIAGEQRIPTLYYIKPDRMRYWTRSAAVRDADEFAAQLMAWQRMVTRAAQAAESTDA